MSAIPPLATIPWTDLKEGKRLGQGAYGVVHLGEWQGRTVAIKKLILDTLTERLAKEFRKEAEVMRRCGESPYIVKVLGICTEETHPALVLEYMPKGSLFDLLSNDELELPWHIRFRIARDAGKGLSYLHDREIVHCDLKSPNILLDAERNAKLSDFGLAKVRFATESKLQSMNTSGKLVGTLNWLAPELFTLEPVYTKESDVYAYALVLYEIASRKIPYAGARVNIEEYVKKGERPTLPDVTPVPYAELIERAWHQNPQERPGVRYIVLQLETWSLPAAAPTMIPRAAPVVSQVPLPKPASPQIAAPYPFPPSSPAHFAAAPQAPFIPASSQVTPSPFVSYPATPSFPTPPAVSQAPLPTSISPQMAAPYPFPPSSPAYFAAAPQAPFIPAGWQLAIPSPTPALGKAPVLPAIPAMAFGKAQWERFFGDVGIEPPLPVDIEAILNSPCPFWSGKKVRETHLLTLIPQTVNDKPFNFRLIPPTVNDKPLTLDSLGELIQRPKQGTATKFDFYNEKLKAQYGHHPVGTAHWVLMTRDVIPGSRRKTFSEQQQLIANIGKGYTMPTLIDAAVSILMAYFAKGERLYGKDPWTFTHCQEKVSFQSVVGGFSAAGLRVDFEVDGAWVVGVAALRKFF